MASEINFSLSLWGSLSSEPTSIMSCSMETPNERIWVIVTPSHLFKALLSQHVLCFNYLRHVFIFVPKSIFFLVWNMHGHLQATL